MGEILEEIQSFIAWRVKEGFDERETIIEAVEDVFFDTCEEDDLEQLASRMTDEAFKEHSYTQSQWSYPTDCDRLDTAFDELNALGIVARQNFSCCQNCGRTEIWDEIKEASKEINVIGFVFYHLQATEYAVDYGTLELVYSSLENDLQAIAEIGEITANTLAKTGLKVQWDADPKNRIRVVDIDWKRRRS